MSKDTIDKVRSFIGDNVVLLAIRKGTKAPMHRGWTGLSVEETRGEKYQASVAKASAIGVALGSQSHGLCSIDIDDDEQVEPFLELNPKFKKNTENQGATRL